MDAWVGCAQVPNQQRGPGCYVTPCTPLTSGRTFYQRVALVCDKISGQPWTFFIGNCSCDPRTSTCPPANDIFCPGNWNTVLNPCTDAEQNTMYDGSYPGPAGGSFQVHSCNPFDLYFIESTGGSGGIFWEFTP